MNAAEPRELGVLQPRNGAEDAHLLGVLQLGLEAHHVEQRAELVVLAKLHDRVGLHRRIVRIGEAERLHRPVAQRFRPALRHHLDRQAAVEIGRDGFPLVERGLVAGDQRVDEALILLARHRAIDVVGARAAGAGLVVARLEPGDRHVDGVAMHDRRDRVEEGERVFAGERAHEIGERRRGEGAGRDDHAVPVRGRVADFLAADRDQRVRLDRRRHGGGKALAVDRERAAGRHLVGVAAAHDQRAEPAHLLVQQADRVGLAVVGAERIGADELGQRLRLVRGGRSRWAASRAAPPGRRGLRSAMPLRSRRGRRR